jgi:SAM-dependent methyltransferase
MFNQHITPLVKSNLDYFNSLNLEKVEDKRDDLIKLYWQYHQRFKSIKTFSVKNGSVLDIGSGSGGLFFWKEYLLPNRKDLKMTAVDLQKGEHFDCYEKYVILNLDDKTLPFDNESFDFIMLSHLIEHVNDWQSLLDQVKRVLKKFGTVYIETPSLHTRDLPKSQYFKDLGFPCQTINFFDDGTHVEPVDLDKVAAYFNAIDGVVLEKGYCKSVYLEDQLLSYGHEHNDMEVAQYGLWSKLLFSSYIVLQKM